jgi:hypothetical protein
MKPFLTILIFGIFMSCQRHRPEMIIEPPPVSTFKDTVNLYNTYIVTYKSGQTQKLQYEYDYIFWSVIDSTKVLRVDTTQHKVFWDDLN